MSDHAIAPLARRQLGPIPINSALALHSEVTQIGAIAAGIQAMIDRGIDTGEILPDDLEALGQLATRQREDLERLRAALAELGAGGRAR